MNHIEMIKKAEALENTAKSWDLRGSPNGGRELREEAQGVRDRARKILEHDEREMDKLLKRAGF